MNDGTYLKRDGYYYPIVLDQGYWAASSETTLEAVVDGELVGIWTDDTGKLWIDNTHYFTGLEQALEFANANNQLTIWDNQNNVTIETRMGVSA